MKIAKLIVILFVVYVGTVIAFESMIGFLQPEAGNNLVITTVGEDGNPHDRVLAHLESGGQMFVAANHWPRTWYKRALANPNVQVSVEGEKGDYLAVPVTRTEHDRVDSENSLPTSFRILTGFPPRFFLRLDPR